MNFVEGKNELNTALREVNTDSVKNSRLRPDRIQDEHAVSIPHGWHMGATYSYRALNPLWSSGRPCPAT